MNNNKNYHPIKINFTEEEYQKIKECADKCGLTIVDFNRMLLQGYHPRPIMNETESVFLERLYMRHGMKNDEISKAVIEEIILDFQKICRWAERSE